MKVIVKLFDPCCKFKMIKDGDFVDLKSSETIEYKAPYADILTKGRTARNVNFEKIMVPLGIGMKLPKGYEAILMPRSSSFKSFGFIQANGVGEIDNSFCGPDDQWYLPIIPLREGKINKYDRVCQFRIQLSQKATVWQRIKWIFSRAPEFEFVSEYIEESINRGGDGSTGIK